MTLKLNHYENIMKEIGVYRKQFELKERKLYYCPYHNYK